jgi:hypothetical protein
MSVSPQPLAIVKPRCWICWNRTGPFTRIPYGPVCADALACERRLKEAA